MKAFLAAGFFGLALIMPSISGASELRLTKDGSIMIELLPGHSVYHEREQEAGVVSAIAITPGQNNAADLTSLCEDLRIAAGLDKHIASSELALEVLFVVPNKGMAIEGYYFPASDVQEREELIPGTAVVPEVLEDILSRAGIPAGILYETGAEQQVSCELNVPAWHVRWEDVRLVGSEEPNSVIERAHLRFMTIYQSVLDHSKALPLPAPLR